jgi:hypothetical protein
MTKIPAESDDQQYRVVRSQKPQEPMVITKEPNIKEETDTQIRMMRDTHERQMASLRAEMEE